MRNSSELDGQLPRETPARQEPQAHLDERLARERGQAGPASHDSISSAAPATPLAPAASASALAPTPDDPPAPPRPQSANSDLPVQLDEIALATPSDSPADLAALREAQRQALEFLMMGVGYAEVARRVGIARRTLYRWVKKDKAFQRALDCWRAAAMCSAEHRLLRGVEVAASTLSEAASYDYRAAAILLKGSGLLAGGPAAPAPPAAVRDTAGVREFLEALSPDKRQAFELRLRELILSFRDEPAASVPLPAAVAAELPDPTAG